MVPKVKVDLPIANITTEKLEVELELSEKALGGALAMLIEDQTHIDNAATAELKTDNNGGVFVVNDKNEIEKHLADKDPRLAALVDAMNALIFGKPKKLGEAEK